MSSEDSLTIFKNLLIDMSIRVAVLEKILLDKKVITLDELATLDEQISQETKSLINEK